jgi:NitT/TauT family transport system substrate-binding protein
VKRAAAVIAAALVLTGCSSAPKVRDPAAARARAGGAVGAVIAPAPVAAAARRHVVRLGYTATIPDAAALAGIQDGYLQEALGTTATLHAIAYPTPAAEAAALAHGQLSAAYLDPVAAVQAWQATRGHIRIIAGAASAGDELIARPHITTPRQLAAAPIAVPPGSTQQAALASWLHQNDPSATPRLVPLTGPQAVAAFKHHTIAAAWEPAPYDTQLAAEHGHIIVTGASLWPGGQYTTAVLAVTTSFLAVHPAQVQDLLAGDIKSQDLLATSPATARTAIAASLATLGVHLTPRQLAASLGQVRYTSNPLAATIAAQAQHAAAAGILKPVTSVRSIYDLTPLNTILRSAGQLLVSS